MRKASPRSFRLLVALAFGLGSQVGCGGGSAKQNYPDAAAFDGNGTAGKGAVGTGGAGAGLTGGSTGGGAAGGATLPTAPPAAGSTLLFGGNTLLVGPGNSCSSATTAAGATAPDKWCGIFTPGATATAVALAVFNLTKALAGTPITCAASDANCVTLSTNIDTNQSDTDVTFGFLGQTLIYYDATSVYAWRPGWTAGRVLLPHSTAQPVSCALGSETAPAVICLATATGTAYAGAIATQTGPNLPMLDVLGAASSGITFSPDGLSVLWSLPTTAPAEDIKTQKLGDATTRATVATGVTAWSLSTDGTRLFWLSTPATDTSGFTTGTLQTAPYPAGTPPQTLQADVWDYSSYGTKGLFTLTAPTALSTTTYGADLNSITDIGNPTTTTKALETKDVIGMIDVHDSGTVLYATALIQPDPTVQSYLIDLKSSKADGTGKCTVAPTATADSSASVSQSGSAVEWVQVTLDASANVTAVDGQVTPITECAPHTFSTSPVSFNDVMTGLLYQENLDATFFTVDLQYALFSAAGAASKPMQVQLSADAVVAPLFPDVAKVVYTISGRTTGNGVYVSGALTGTPTADFAPAPRGLRVAPADLAAARQAPHGYALSNYGARLGRVPSPFAPLVTRGARMKPVESGSAFAARVASRLRANSLR